LPQYAPAPYGQVRQRTAPGDPRDYAPPIRCVPEPKSKDKITKSGELKFDEDNRQWHFGTKEAPRVKWLESVWHVTDLPQTKDPDFLVMLNEYYLCGHVVDPPDQDRLPVVPGGMRHWLFSRSRPPPPPERPLFDLRYDPKHAFDRAAAGGSDNKYWSGGGKGEIGTGDLARMPAFQPGQNFVRLVIRHPFNGRGGDWAEDIDEAKYLTVMDVVNIISEMVHMHIDQTLDWGSLSEADRSFVYEAYFNRPCPDEDATGRRLHLFCDKYMFGGIEQLPAKAKRFNGRGTEFLGQVDEV
ncbi:hypothetical protein FRC10_008373, partial [Ceratobasidium sp. 414]